MCPQTRTSVQVGFTTYINSLVLLLVRLWSQPVWSLSFVNEPGPRLSSEYPGSLLLHGGLAELPGPFSDYLSNSLSKEGESSGPRELCSRHKREEKIKETHTLMLSTPKHHPYSNQGVSWRFLFCFLRYKQDKSGGRSCAFHKTGVVNWAKERLSLGQTNICSFLLKVTQKLSSYKHLI